MANRGSLPMLHRGDQIAADHYGVITDFVNNPSMSLSFGQNAGMYDASGGALSPTKRPKPAVRIIADADYPRHSAILLSGDPHDAQVMPIDDGSDPCWYALRASIHPSGFNGTTNSHRIFVTNEDAEILEGEAGWATLIGNEPVAVLGDEYWPPAPFHPCGPEAGKTTVSGRTVGLLAVSNVNDYGLVHVVAHTPPFLFAKTTSLLLPTDDIILPHFCGVNVHFPKHFLASAYWPDELEESQDPAFIGLQAYTHDSTLEVPAGTFCHIVFEYGRWYITWVAC